MHRTARARVTAPLFLALYAACGRTSFALDRTSEPDDDAGISTGLPLGSSCTEDSSCAATLFCDRLCGPYTNPFLDGWETYLAVNGVCAPLAQAPYCDTTCPAPNDCCDPTHHCRPQPFCNFTKVYRTDCAPSP